MNHSSRSTPFDPHARSVAARFSAAAAQYEKHDDVQVHAAREVARRLGALRAGGRLLEIGCGTGRLTRLLVERFPAVPIDAIDISERMIAACRERFRTVPSVRWHVCDARDFGATGAYAALASSSSMHWILPRAAFLRRLHGLLEPGGVLALAIMVHGTLAELHEARAQAAPHKAARAALPDADAFLADLGAAGFRAIEHAVEERVARHPSAGELLRSLHLQGLTGGDYSRGASPLGRRDLAALAAAYDARYTHPQGGVRATYRLLYVRATA